MPIDIDVLRQGITRIAAKLESDHQMLSDLDGKIGDGDLGITLLKAFRELDGIKAALPDDVGAALMQSAGAVAKVSSSSFGTLLATGLIAVAKLTKGQTSAPWSGVSGYLDAVVAAMMMRGKASLGDKTVLDALDAAARATEGIDDPAELLKRAREAVAAALGAFRDKPNKIGRARIFADKTIGMDDPGMVAFDVMLAALAG